MPMTMTEKLLARASGLASVKPGDIVTPEPELVIMHDGYIETAYKQLTEIGYKRITKPERVMIITDHQPILTTPRAIEQARANCAIADEWQVGQFFAAGRAGHGHIYPMESGDVRPGMFLISYDMHCTNFGAIGAFALRAGPDIPTVLATGSMWTVVPETLRIDLTGAFAPGVHPRDLGFRLSADLTSGKLGVAFDYRVVEFGGPAVTSMTLASRIALCNTLTEIGVINILFPPVSPLGASPDATWVESDPDAHFENRLTLDLSTVEPQVALPGGPDRSVPVSDVVGRRVDQAFLGACGSATYEDFSVALEVLGDRKIAPGVRLIVAPGTNAIAKQMATTGLMQKLIDAGAILLTPGCGPCAGGIGGPLGPGEVSISTAATNGAGRMGAKDSECYLASPRTVAESAATGVISDPRPAMH